MEKYMTEINRERLHEKGKTCEREWRKNGDKKDYGKERGRKTENEAKARR